MGFSMDVTDTETLKDEVVEMVKPVPAEETRLKEMAQKNALSIMNCDLDSFAEKQDILKTIEQFGMDTMTKSSQKNAMLQVPVGNLSKAGDEGSMVSKSLLDLQRQVKDLDPSLVDFAKTGLLGKVFNPIRSYFDKYQKAETVINSIIVSLDKGKETLKNDNITLEIEEASLRDLTKKLLKEIEMASLMDENIETQINEAKARNEDEYKIKFVTEEILFPLRQRVMDMQQMMVVNQQGIMAIEVIKRNNKELIRGVDRAKNVTISALKIAVMVASALYNQRIVLQKIQALNETTNNIISGTSKMLKDQGAEIHRQSVETGVSVETLKTSFSDIISSLEAISTYKQQALPQMRTTINQFREMAEDGEKRIQQLEKQTAFS